MARAVEPNHSMGAFVTVASAPPVLHFLDLPQMSVIFWLLILACVVKRTAGPLAGLLDALALLGLGGWFCRQRNWGYGGLAALAFLLDSELPKSVRRYLIFALMAVIVTAIAAVPGSADAGRGGVSLSGGLSALAHGGSTCLKGRPVAAPPTSPVQFDVMLVEGIATVVGLLLGAPGSIVDWIACLFLTCVIGAVRLAARVLWPLLPAQTEDWMI